MTEQEQKEFLISVRKVIVTIGGVLTVAWIIYYLYDLLWK